MSVFNEKRASIVRCRPTTVRYLLIFIHCMVYLPRYLFSPDLDLLHLFQRSLLQRDFHCKLTFGLPRLPVRDRQGPLLTREVPPVTPPRYRRVPDRPKRPSLRRLVPPEPNIVLTGPTTTAYVTSPFPRVLPLTVVDPLCPPPSVVGSRPIRIIRHNQRENLNGRCF